MIVVFLCPTVTAGRMMKYCAAVAQPKRIPKERKGVSTYGNCLTGRVILSLFTKADFNALVHMYYISTLIEINLNSFLLMTVL